MRRRRSRDPSLDMYYCRLVRIKIPVAVKDPASVVIEQLCAPELFGHCLTDVSIDPRRCCRPYRYIYGNCVFGPRPSNFLNASCRIDVMDGSIRIFHDLPNAVPSGAPTFVPRPGADPDDETDGVVILDFLSSDSRSFLVILDGRSFTETARVVAPSRHCGSYGGNTWHWGHAA